MKIITSFLKGFMFLLSLVIISIIIVSFSLSKERSINPYCKNNYENEVIELNYKEIKEYEINFNCSTMYFKLLIDENLKKQDIISLLISIGNDLKDYDCFTHFEIYSSSLTKPIYAVIDLDTNEVSIIG